MLSVDEDVVERMEDKWEKWVYILPGMYVPCSWMEKRMNGNDAAGDELGNVEE